MSPKEIAMTTAIVEYDFKPLARIGSPENMRDMMRSERMQNALRDILPKFSDEPDPDKHIARLVAQAGIAFMNTPRLADCTQISIFEAMMNVASTGLSLARQAGEAYLIPFRDNRKGVTIQSGGCDVSCPCACPPLEMSIGTPYATARK